MADRAAWESVLTSMIHELPQPVVQDAVADGSLLLIGGDPPEVVVRLTRSMASISEYAVEWEGPEEAVVRPILLGSVQWRRLPEVPAIAALNTLIRAARESRRSKYRACLHCDRLIPPESVADDGLCGACR